MDTIELGFCIQTSYVSVHLIRPQHSVWCNAYIWRNLQCSAVHGSVHSLPTRSGRREMQPTHSTLVMKSADIFLTMVSNRARQRQSFEVGFPQCLESHHSSFLFSSPKAVLLPRENKLSYNILACSTYSEASLATNFQNVLLCPAPGCPFHCYKNILVRLPIIRWTYSVQWGKKPVQSY